MRKLYFYNSILIFILFTFFSLALNTKEALFESKMISNYIYTFLGISLLYGFFQFESGKSVFSKKNLLHGLIALSIFLVEPTLQYLSFGSLSFGNVSLQFLYSSLLFFSLSLGQEAFYRKYRSAVKTAILFTFFDLLALIYPSISLAYYFKFSTIPTIPIFMVTYYTTINEALSFLSQTLSHGTIFITIVTFASLCYLLYKGNQWQINNNDISSIRKTVYPFLIFTVICTIATSALTYLPNGMRTVYKYSKALESYHIHHDEAFNSIAFKDPSHTLISTLPGTVIVVIGESANRDYMRVFNENSPYATTPWESEMKAENRNFLFFNNAYSSYVQTTISLERALTQNSQYHEVPFLDATTFVDIARKLGYHTYWFSNQNIIGSAATTNSVIAGTAHQADWMSSIYKKELNYDNTLVEQLKTLPTKDNNLVILHLKGSHADYTDRYPSDSSLFGTKGEVELYSNSLLYTDKVLQEIYTYGKEHMNLQAMLYFSDHGEEMGIGHNPDMFTFSQTRIPLWIYLSPEYEKAYPETVSLLRARENTFWTNDLFYDLFTGVLHAPNSTYIPSQDLSNPAYNFNEHTLTTMLGQYKISEDPALQK